MKVAKKKRMAFLTFLVLLEAFCAALLIIKLSRFLHKRIGLLFSALAFNLSSVSLFQSDRGLECGGLWWGGFSGRFLFPLFLIHIIPLGWPLSELVDRLLQLFQLANNRVP